MIWICAAAAISARAIFSCKEIQYHRSAHQHQHLAYLFPRPKLFKRWQMLSTTLLTSAKMTKRKPKGFDCSSPTPDKRQIVKLLKVSTPLCSSIVLVISNLSDKCWLILKLWSNLERWKLMNFLKCSFRNHTDRSANPLLSGFTRFLCQP